MKRDIGILKCCCFKFKFFLYSPAFLNFSVVRERPVELLDKSPQARVCRVAGLCGGLTGDGRPRPASDKSGVAAVRATICVIYSEETAAPSLAGYSRAAVSGYKSPCCIIWPSSSLQMESGSVGPPRLLPSEEEEE